MGIKNPDNMDKRIRQWDCRNASPAFTLYQSIQQYLRMYYCIQTDSPIESETTLDAIMTFLSTKNGRDVLDFYHEHGATYPKELEKALNIKDTTVKNRISALMRLGIIHQTAKLDRTSGGRIPTITSLVVAGPEYTTKAQARFDQSRGLASHGKILDQYTTEKEAIVDDYAIQQAQEQADAELQIILEQVKAEFLSQYGADGNPVNLRDIERSLRTKGIRLDDRPDRVQTVAEYLETEGVRTGIYRNGTLSPGYQPSLAIQRIRNQRG